MNGPDPRGMKDLASYAPVRIAVLGLLRAGFGLLILGMGALVLFDRVSAPHGPRAPGDMPGWWMLLVSLALAFGGFAIATGGLGRCLSAFARDCYFRAGPEGLAIRLPKLGWFGRFRIIEHRLQWREINQFIHFTYRVNLIPVASELRIQPVDGEMIAIERRLFSASVKNLIQQLQTIQTTAVR